MSKYTSLLENFHKSEFQCGCGCGLGSNDMSPKLLNRLDIAREFAGVPFVINSSIRCASHNEKIGGRINSAHLSGCAVDIKAADSSSRFKIIESLLCAGFNRIGVYATFIHVDNDQTKPQKVFWVNE